MSSFAKEVTSCGKTGIASQLCIKNNQALDTSLIYDDYDNLRFTGANPNNYVSFNNELWRIIGIFDNKLKIIKNDSIGNRVWNNTEQRNTWATSDIAYYLNNDYKINSNLIVSGNWNAGKELSYQKTAKDSYSGEEKLKWIGKVGLITASDYGYAVGGDVRDTCLKITLINYNSENCGANNWLRSYSNYNTWSMSTTSGNSNNAYVVSNDGILYNGIVTGIHMVLPVVYLNTDTRITWGNGTSSSPFILEL